MLLGKSSKQSLILKQYLGIADHKQRQQPRRFNMKHKYIILLHLEGYGTSDICRMVRCSCTMVYNTINSEQGQAIIQEYQGFLDTEFKSLYALSIEAIRRGLTSIDDEVALKAADKFLKAHGRYERKDTGTPGETAEDVITRVFERITDGETIRITEERHGAAARGAARETNRPADKGNGPSNEPMDAIEDICLTTSMVSGNGNSEQLAAIPSQRRPSPDSGEHGEYIVVERNSDREHETDSHSAKMDDSD